MKFQKKILHKPQHSLDENKVMNVKNYVENAIQLQPVHFDLQIDDDQSCTMSRKNIQPVKITKLLS